MGRRQSSHKTTSYSVSSRPRARIHLETVDLGGGPFGLHRGRGGTPGIGPGSREGDPVVEVIVPIRTQAIWRFP